MELLIFSCALLIGFAVYAFFAGIFSNRQAKKFLKKYPDAVKVYTKLQKRHLIFKLFFFLQKKSETLMLSLNDRYKGSYANCKDGALLLIPDTHYIIQARWENYSFRNRSTVDSKAHLFEDFNAGAGEVFTVSYNRNKKLFTIERIN